MKEMLTNFQKNLLEKELKNPNLSVRDNTRIQIMLLFAQGNSQKQICSHLNCSPVTARTWIQVVKSGQAHRWRDFCQDGRPKCLEEIHRSRLIELVQQSPRAVGFFVDKWTATALQKQLWKEFELQVSTRHINRVLREAGFPGRNRSQPEQPRPAARHSKLVIHDLLDVGFPLSMPATLPSQD